jgi:hypothetical protein
VLRGGLLVGAGLATAGVASAALTGTAKAVSSPQLNWAWCEYCEGMWFTNDSTNPVGACPATYIGHTSTNSHNYELFNSSGGGGISPGYQGSWNWCYLCEGLFTTLHTPSWCPGTSTDKGGEATGSHKTGILTYYLWINPVTGTNPQPGWRWCHNCQGLYYQGSEGTSEGICPAPSIWMGHHNGAGSDIYAIDWDGSL